MIELTDQMREYIATAAVDGTPVLVATASADGHPDIAFKGSTMVWDGDHLAFWERAFGQTLSNMAENPNVCLQYFSREKRTGWKFFGVAELHREGDLRQQIMDRTIQLELDRDPERKGVAVLVRIDQVKQGMNILMQRD
ncbi:MAG: pyridoxamine 5'-phosphate oxidase family protein [Dehalococcoidia bacterium]